MAMDHVIFLSVPGLRPRDVDAQSTPTLHRWAAGGAMAELTPTFPCVTSCVQASFWTGTGPGRHGVIANGFYYPERHEVEFWVARNGVIAGEQVWEALKRSRPGVTSAVWHAQNIKDAAADVIITPEPIHEPDGTTRLWCYAKPDGLYAEMIEPLGHFPLQHYWGPLANIESTRWILRAAAWLIERQTPNFHWIYIPHLDYAAQKFGPNSPQARAALTELDAELAAFVERVCDDRGRLASPSGSGGGEVVFLVAGEYALTDVQGVVYPNRVLREAGLLAVREEEGAEHIDLVGSRAFAMVDHQLAHVYVQGSAEERKATVAAVCALFRERPGIAGVHAGAERAAVGMEHPRSGDVILITRDDHWLAYYWWLDDAAAPGFARTVDIHRKPGYDAVELYFDPATRSIPLNADLVRGSHGVLAREARHRTALICSSSAAALDSKAHWRDTDIKQLCLDLLT